MCDLDAISSSPFFSYVPATLLCKYLARGMPCAFMSQIKTLNLPHIYPFV